MHQPTQLPLLLLQWNLVEWMTQRYLPLLPGAEERACETFQWRIEDWNSLEKRVTGPEFEIGGCKWYATFALCALAHGYTESWHGNNPYLCISGASYFSLKETMQSACRCIWTPSMHMDKQNRIGMSARSLHSQCPTPVIQPSMSSIVCGP
jgi:hypothetical protein